MQLSHVFKRRLTLSTVVSRPVAITDTGGRFQVVGAVLRAAGQTLIDLLVHSAAVLALPAGLAVALATDAGAVAGAGRVQAVGCVSERASQEGERALRAIKTHSPLV